MIHGMSKQQHRPLGLLIIGLFLVYCFPLIMHGIHGDGLLYSIISLNLAHGIGSVWEPTALEFFWPHFYEHPPFAFYLQSCFIKLFGDSVFVDKFYFFVIALAELSVFLFFWRQSNKKISRYCIGIPLLCWLLTPRLFLFHYGHVEYTLIVFTTLASYLTTYSLLNNKHHILCYLLSALCLVAAFFTNGLQAFFPLGIPVVYHMVFSKKNIVLGAIQTMGLGILTALLIGFIFWLEPAAYANINHYFKQQVLATLLTGRDSNHSGFFNHFYGLIYIVYILMPLIVITLFSLGKYASIASPKELNKSAYTRFISPLQRDKWTLFYIAVGFSAFLPVLISARQHAHYFLQAYPFFVLAFAQILTPMYSHWAQQIDITHKGYQWTVKSLTLVIFILILLIIKCWGGIYTQTNYIQDILHLKKILPAHTRVSLDRPGSVVEKLTLLLYRYNFNTLCDCAGEQYYIQEKNTTTTPKGYRRIPEAFNVINLYKKNV